MSDSEIWIVLEAGCAECLDDPLMESGGSFNSLEEAKADCSPYAESSKWREHPGGGVYIQSGSGSTWIVPLSALRIPTEKVTVNG